MASCTVTWSGAAARVTLDTCKQACASTLQAHPFYPVRSFLKPPLILPQPSLLHSLLTPETNDGLRCQAAASGQESSLLAPGFKRSCQPPANKSSLFVQKLRQTSKCTSRFRCEWGPEHDSEAALLGGEVQDSRPSSAFTQERAALGGTCVNRPQRWDVVGLGQAMVDFSGTVSDDLLDRLALEKGKRKVVDHNERGKVLRALDGKNYKVTAGGSLSNTLVALARLGQGAGDSQGDELAAPLSVAMTGSVGSDPLGQFYRAKLLRAGVHFLSTPIPEGTTGTVVVLTTPDAQRTMLSYQGMSSEVAFDETLEKSLSCARALVVEGYLWEIPETIEAIQKATKAAREQGCLVALTASDVTCVKRYRETFWNVMAQDADLLFCNADEARALADEGAEVTPHSLAQKLSCYCPMIVVTDGPAGSYLGLRGEVCFVPPWPCEPVDTCGAGDAYAAGILYGLLRGGMDLESMGNFAARVASVVVAQQGARLGSVDAQWLVGCPPNVAPGHLDVGGDSEVGVTGVMGNLRVPLTTKKGSML